MDNIERQQTEPKQVIIVRRDLNMPQGKLAAQCAHASLGALIKCGFKSEEMLHIDLKVGTAVEKWLNGRFTKIVLYVKSEEKLLSLFKDIEDHGLPCALITDAGFTVFDGKPTNTCIGVGPVFPDEIDAITKKLRLL